MKKYTVEIQKVERDWNGVKGLCEVDTLFKSEDIKEARNEFVSQMNIRLKDCVGVCCNGNNYLDKLKLHFVENLENMELYTEYTCISFNEYEYDDDGEIDDCKLLIEVYGVEY